MELDTIQILQSCAKTEETLKGSDSLSIEVRVDKLG